jgi:hypothetical protein
LPGDGQRTGTVAEWKTDDPLAQWRVGKYFIREKGRCLGHAAGATAGAEPALLARKHDEPLELIRSATHTKKPVFEATAFEIRFKFLMDMRRQTSTLGI